MTTTSHQRITQLRFKSEDENEDGMVVGSLTDQDGRNVFPGEKWVTKQEALRVARELHLELEES